MELKIKEKVIKMNTKVICNKCGKEIEISSDEIPIYETPNVKVFGDHCCKGSKTFYKIPNKKHITYLDKTKNKKQKITLKLTENDYLPKIEVKCKVSGKIHEFYHIKELTDIIKCSSYSLKWTHYHMLEKVLKGIKSDKKLTDDEKERDIENAVKSYTILVIS